MPGFKTFREIHPWFSAFYIRILPSLQASLSIKHYMIHHNNSEMRKYGLGLFIFRNIHVGLYTAIRVYMGWPMWQWYLSHMRPAKAQASLCIRTVSSEPSLFSHMKYGSRRRFRSKIRHLVPLDGWMAAHACLKNKFTEDEKYHNRKLLFQRGKPPPYESHIGRYVSFVWVHM